MGINRIPPQRIPSQRISSGEALDRLHAVLREAEENARSEGLMDVELLAGAAAEAAEQYLTAWQERQPVAAQAA